MGKSAPKVSATKKPPGKANKIGFAAALFSKVQLRLLSLLLGHPERGFHASEIIKLLNSGTGGVQRELAKLTQAGILTCTADDNRKKYQANKEAPIFEELSRIILKSTGLVEPIKNALDNFQDKIRFAFIYGSIAKGTDTAKSDIDVMIVGENLSYGEIFGALQPAEKSIRRTINPNIMSTSEWRRTLAADNSFLKAIVHQPKIMIIGSDNELQGA
jgi:predicted nucleotidyltransferase